MKILSLQIQGYKNLKDKTKASFDFSKCTNYVALIGLNGSGKSNVLEAISIIFSSLYHDKAAGFNYQIKYLLDNDEVTVTNGNMVVRGKGRITKPNQATYLPENVIASYSGEELRMWENIYLDSYADFFQDIKKQSSFVPKLLYINKYCWDYALIALLCSENPNIQKFIKEVLKIGDDVEISFTIETANYGLYEANDALSLIKRIVDLQNDSDTNSVHIKEISTLDIGQKDNSEFTKRLFYYLFITGMPVKGDRIKADKIIRKTELRFNGIDVQKLSEGEKKLILINCITHLLSDNKTLVLLDEPDAHIHIDRKKEIVEIIDQSNLFTIFTTHSPKILHCIKDENVRIINTADDTGLEAVYLDKLKALENLTNGEFTLVDATVAISSKKPLLLVEGKGDAAYINTAIKLLSSKAELDIDILPFGGAGNAKGFLDELIKCVPKGKKIIVLFDRDEAGAGSEKGGMKSFVNFTGGRANINTYEKGHCIYLMLPKTATHTETDFLIEDYFSNDKKNEVAKKCIENANGAFNSFPKDLRQSIKDELGKNLEVFTKVDFADFQVLIDKLKSIIGGTEVLHKEEVPAKSTAKQVAVKQQELTAVAKKAATKKLTKKTVIKK